MEPRAGSDRFDPASRTGQQLAARSLFRRGARLVLALGGALALGLRRQAPRRRRPSALFRAAPRMSPSEAPESDEPYCATASFSSAISSALIDTETLRALASTWVTTASNLSPTPKRSGRCSERSRDRSERRMKVVRSWSISLTSMPLSLTAVTSQVTRRPFFSLVDGAPEANGSAVELLDAEADALLLGVDVEHHGLDGVALLVVLDRLLARLVPVEVGQMHHAVDAAVEADEQAELGDVADLALDVACRADGWRRTRPTDSPGSASGRARCGACRDRPRAPAPRPPGWSRRSCRDGCSSWSSSSPRRGSGLRRRAPARRRRRSR